MKVRRLPFRYLYAQSNFILISSLYLEDELQNVDLAESEKDARRQELKTKRRDYTGYDDDEFGSSAVAGMKRGVLAKYDEDIDGPSESVSSNFLRCHLVADS